MPGRPDQRAAGHDGGHRRGRRRGEAIGDADIVVTATGNKDIIMLEHIKGDEGPRDPGKYRPSDNLKIDMAGLESE